VHRFGCREEEERGRESRDMPLTPRAEHGVWMPGVKNLKIIKQILFIIKQILFNSTYVDHEVNKKIS